MSLSSLLLASLLGPTAHAFCGTYVGTAGAPPLNRTSQVVMARDGGQLTLTLMPDVVGGVPALAMVVPVPADFERADVSVVDPGLMSRVQTYAGPRRVQYTCEDLYGSGSGGGSGACGGFADTLLDAAWAKGMSTLASQAVVPADAVDLQVLSASDSADVGAWLAGDGWTVDPNTEALLAEYADAGQRFVVMRVDEDQLKTGQLWLPPIQLRYRTDMLFLPVRLGAAASPGTQDVVLHVISDRDDGQAGIASYPEFAVEGECMWEEGAGGFDGFYDQSFADAFQAEGSGAAWTTEYVWAPAKCDPCTGEGPLDAATMEALGAGGEPNQTVLTRMRLRGQADALQQDLSVYFSGIGAQHQQRYIDYAPELESEFPLCGQGWVEDAPGECEAGDSGQAAFVLPALAFLPWLFGGWGVLRR